MKSFTTSEISVNDKRRIRFETFSMTTKSTEIFVDEKQFPIDDEFATELKNVLKSEILDRILQNLIFNTVVNIKRFAALLFNDHTETEYLTYFPVSYFENDCE